MGFWHFGLSPFCHARFVRDAETPEGIFNGWPFVRGARASRAILGKRCLQAISQH
jgi:hypothetical protein